MSFLFERKFGIEACENGDEGDGYFMKIFFKHLYHPVDISLIH